MLEVASRPDVITLRWPPLRPGVHHYAGVSLGVLLSGLCGSMLVVASITFITLDANPAAPLVHQPRIAALLSGLVAVLCLGIGGYWLRIAGRSTQPESVLLDAETLTHQPGWPGLVPFCRSRWYDASRPRDEGKHTFGRASRMPRSTLKGVVRQEDRLVIQLAGFWRGNVTIGVGLSAQDLDLLHKILTDWLQKPQKQIVARTDADLNR